MSHRIHEDTATEIVYVTHQERRAQLTKAGAPRKDGRTTLSVVIDAEFSGPHRHLEASATLAEIKGHPVEAARIRENLAAETAPHPAPRGDFLAALMAL